LKLQNTNKKKTPFPSPQAKKTNKPGFRRHLSFFLQLDKMKIMLAVTIIKVAMKNDMVTAFMCLI